jgi:hypothetical protein
MGNFSESQMTTANFEFELVECGRVSEPGQRIISVEINAKGKRRVVGGPQPVRVVQHPFKGSFRPNRTRDRQVGLVRPDPEGNERKCDASSYRTRQMPASCEPELDRVELGCIMTSLGTKYF